MKDITKIQLLAEIVQKRKQVDAIEAREQELKRIDTKKSVLESERALLVAIDKFLEVGGPEQSAENWPLILHLSSAQLHLEKVIKEQIGE